MAAKHTVRERTILVLSAHDTEVFVDSLLNPPKPGPILRNAAKRYKSGLACEACQLSKLPFLWSRCKTATTELDQYFQPRRVRMQGAEWLGPSFSLITNKPLLVIRHFLPIQFI